VNPLYINYHSICNAGLGYGSATVKNRAVNSITWTVVGGLSYQLLNNMRIDLSYKLTSMKAVSENKNSKAIDENAVEQIDVVKITAPALSHALNFALRAEFEKSPPT
jgi:long-subunit fatty acid transport protein